MAKIKICGLKRREDIEYVNELKPDYAGFILTAGFRRSISYETARYLKSLLSPDIKAVGVFVNDDIDTVNSFVNESVIDIVQLHGSESARYCEEVKADVIKYFSPKDFQKISDYDVKYYLFDSGTGTGKTFDWCDIPKCDKPFFLAGGIDTLNIERAIKENNPYAVDVSSGVETNGVKDYNKIKQIIEITRSFE